MPEDFYPTLMFGFLLSNDKKEVLHQMWVTNMGTFEWRPVPLVQMKDDRPQAIAGYLDEDD